MSHAVVLVIGDDIDGQMAAYDENKTVEPYKDYVGTPDPERWPWSPALEQRPGLDITDHAAVIAAYAEHYPDSVEEERYEFDENGLYSYKPGVQVGLVRGWRALGRLAAGQAAGSGKRPQRAGQSVLRGAGGTGARALRPGHGRYGRRSGVMLVGGNGPVDPDEIDASEAGGA